MTDDATIRALNRSWRKKDEATDVLSFPMSADEGLLGDVVISLDTARRQAKEYKNPLEHELVRYLAHGLLHLLGYDHHRPKDRARMAAAERRLLGRDGMLG